MTKKIYIVMNRRNKQYTVSLKDILTMYHRPTRKTPTLPRYVETPNLPVLRYG